MKFGFVAGFFVEWGGEDFLNTEGAEGAAEAQRIRRRGCRRGGKRRMKDPLRPRGADTSPGGPGEAMKRGGGSGETSFAEAVEGGHPQAVAPGGFYGLVWMP